MNRRSVVVWFLRATWAQGQTPSRPHRRYHVHLLVGRESFRIRFQTMGRRLGWIRRRQRASSRGVASKEP